MGLKPKRLRFGVVIAVEVDAPTKREAVVAINQHLSRSIESVRQGEVTMIQARVMGDMMFFFDPFGVDEMKSENGP